MKKTKENQTKEILIIEEQSIVSLDLQKKLEKGGYHIQTSNSFDRAPSGQNPDMVITDSAPKNPSFFRRMKTILMGQFLPVICTSNKCIEGLKKIKELKIIARFLKPFDTQDILNKINKYFKTSTSKLANTSWKRKS